MFKTFHLVERTAQARVDNELDKNRLISESRYFAVYMYYKL